MTAMAQAIDQLIRVCPYHCPGVMRQTKWDGQLLWVCGNDNSHRLPVEQPKQEGTR